MILYNVIRSSKNEKDERRQSGGARELIYEVGDYYAFVICLKYKDGS